MPWQKNYDNVQVLENAMLAFWRHGYEGTSMRDLVAATGINRGSIYAAFESKHALFMRALKHYDQVFRAAHLERIGSENAPVDAISAVFDAAAAQHDRPPGCLLVNTALELSPHDPEVSEFVARSLADVESFFRNRIETAQQTGELRESLDARSTAQALLGLFLGLRVLTRAGVESAIVDSIVNQARTMLQ